VLNNGVNKVMITESNMGLSIDLKYGGIPFSFAYTVQLLMVASERGSCGKSNIKPQLNRYLDLVGAPLSNFLIGVNSLYCISTLFVTQSCAAARLNYSVALRA